jgi:hypothetical protein
MPGACSRASIRGPAKVVPPCFSRVLAKGCECATATVRWCCWPLFDHRGLSETRSKIKIVTELDKSGKVHLAPGQHGRASHKDRPYRSPDSSCTHPRIRALLHRCGPQYPGKDGHVRGGDLGSETSYRRFRGSGRRHAGNFYRRGAQHNHKRVWLPELSDSTANPAPH